MRPFFPNSGGFIGAGGVGLRGRSTRQMRFAAFMPVLLLELESAGTTLDAGARSRRPPELRIDEKDDRYLNQH